MLNRSHVSNPSQLKTHQYRFLRGTVETSKVQQSFSFIRLKRYDAWKRGEKKKGGEKNNNNLPPPPPRPPFIQEL